MRLTVVADTGAVLSLELSGLFRYVKSISGYLLEKELLRN